MEPDYVIVSDHSVTECCRSMPLTMYKNVNDQGETSFGLTCVSTHSLLSHKDSASTGHMIRNLSKNNTAELEGQDQELAASLTGGHLTHGVNRLLFALEVNHMVQGSLTQVILVNRYCI